MTEPMTEATVERAADQAKLAPQVRNALLALIVGGIAAILDSTIVTLALHTLLVRLHPSDGTIQWVTTGYLLAMAVAIPVTGWAENRFTRRTTCATAVRASADPGRAGVGGQPPAPRSTPPRCPDAECWH